MHQPANARSQARLDHVPRTFDVRPRDHRRVGVVAVDGSHVEDRVAALDDPAQTHGVEQVDALGPHVGALLGELARDVPADEPARTRDVGLHVAAIRLAALPCSGQGR